LNYKKFVEKKMLIVHVEDDNSFQQAVEKALKAQQFEVVAFNDAINALNYLELVEPDILLVDFRLGGPNGLKLAIQVRALYPACAIVLISGYATKLDVREAFRSGADDFLFKPIEMEQLVAEVFNAFRRRRTLFPKNLSSANTASNGSRIFNETKRTVLWNNQSIQLTALEFKLVTTLAANPDRLFTPQELYAIASGNQFSAEKAQHTLGVHMVNLRRKIKKTGNEDFPIQNVRGKGYKWVSQEDPPK
jgi:DNA-binding response OmpR family regulator